MDLPCRHNRIALLAVAFAASAAMFLSGCSERAEQSEPAASQPAAAPAAIAHERHIALDGQPNFRDLGGYETADGRTVKWGIVYRSGELPRMTDEDLARLEELGIRTVISFLTEVEIEARGEDRLPDGVKEIAAPIAVGDDLARRGLEARQTGDFSMLPPEINPEVHEILAAEATAEYALLLRAIADEANRPIVFHCSHGVHRTGTATAILLWSLGVPWETVREDYLLSNTYRMPEIEQRLAQLRQMAAEKQGIEPEQVDMTNIEAFYILQGAYIDASRDYILAEHGSIDAYLGESLGLSEQEVVALREALLE